MNHLDPEVRLHCEELGDQKARLQRHLGTQPGAPLGSEALVDHSDEQLVLAAVLLHVKGQLSNQRALVDGSNFGLAWSCLS